MCAPQGAVCGPPSQGEPFRGADAPSGEVLLSAHARPRGEGRFLCAETPPLVTLRVCTKWAPSRASPKTWQKSRERARLAANGTSCDKSARCGGMRAPRERQRHREQPATARVSAGPRLRTASRVSAGSRLRTASRVSAGSRLRTASAAPAHLQGVEDRRLDRWWTLSGAHRRVHARI